MAAAASAGVRSPASASSSGTPAARSSVMSCMSAGWRSPAAAMRSLKEMLG